MKVPADGAFVPYAPLNVPKAVATDLWIVDGPDIRFNYLGLKLPFPTRMIVVRLPDGGLWLHSPTEPDEALTAALRAIGPVRFLIAPNTLHYWWIADWKALFPAASVHCAPGLARSAKRPLPPHEALGDIPSAGWADVIDQVLVTGDVLNEVVFFHKPTRTLILTDLIENLELPRTRFRWLRVLLRLGGAVDPDGKAPIDMRLTFMRHRRTVKAAVHRMMAWEPQRIVMAHGRCYETNAAAELRRAFRWAA